MIVFLHTTFDLNCDQGQTAAVAQFASGWLGAEQENSYNY
jgi:hypothetical protein